MNKKRNDVIRVSWPKRRSVADGTLVVVLKELVERMELIPKGQFEQLIINIGSQLSVPSCERVADGPQFPCFRW